jgi:hypothetical protein
MELSLGGLLIFGSALVLGFEVAMRSPFLASRALQRGRASWVVQPEASELQRHPNLQFYRRFSSSSA